MLKKRGNALTFTGTPTRENLISSIVEMYRLAVTQLPKDVVDALKAGYEAEKEARPKHVLKTMLRNIEMADVECKPLCQDTGIPLVYVKYQSGKYTQLELKEIIREATKIATKQVPMRANAYDVMKGKVIGNYPTIYFKETKDETQIQLLLKGGGSENVSRVYQLPNIELGAERDFDGVQKVIVDAVVQAQGRGCPPYIIGAALCGNMEEASYRAKNRHLLKITKKNPDPKLRAFEQDTLEKINALNVGPMGVGGGSTALAVKFTPRYVHPASWFVGVSVGCWSMRRASLKLP